MKWRVELRTEVHEWYSSLSRKPWEEVTAVIELLQELGPALGRPRADHIKGSRFKNMKELRTGTFRILFAFTPERTAILLEAGDKFDNWDKWYVTAIPIADKRFEEELRKLRKI